LFEYNPIFNIWEEMTDLNTDKAIYIPHVFAVGNKICTVAIRSYMDEKYLNIWVYEK
jgi:hypothetical protein